MLQLKVILSELSATKLVLSDPVKAKRQFNFFWINQASVECVKLHHETGVLLLYLTSFSENVKKPCCETLRLGALNSIMNRKNGLH